MTNANKQNLINEGSINFWIRIKENPKFSHKDSYLKFIYRKFLGGIILSVLKEEEKLRIEIENPEYGLFNISHDISQLLENDLMVTITWKENTASLYLNSELAEEVSSKEGLDVGSNALFDVSNISVGPLSFGENVTLRGIIKEIRKSSFLVDFSSSIRGLHENLIEVSKNRVV